MQNSSLTMHDTKMCEAESNSTEKIGLGSDSHKINDWLINQISTGIFLPNIFPCSLVLVSIPVVGKCLVYKQTFVYHKF